jgi:hypothetical protein
MCAIKKKTKDLWTILAKGELLGVGQGYFEVFYTKQEAQRRIRIAEKAVGIKLYWRVVCCVLALA